MTSRFWRVATAAFAALFASVALACGGSDQEEESAVSEVVAAAIMNDDEERLCNELLSERFVEAVYGDLETCLAAEAPDDDDGEDANEVTVADIEIDGDTATATVTEVGGDTDGATGGITLVLVSDNWRIDQLGIDYLRSILAQGLLNEKEYSEEEHGPLADETVRECFRQGMDELDDEDFRQIAYDGMADRDPSETFIGVLTDCMAETPGGEAEDVSGQADGGDGEGSLLRRQFEEGIRESALADDASEEEINCVIKQLRKTVSDDEIIEQVGNEDVDGALAKKAAVAISKC